MPPSEHETEQDLWAPLPGQRLAVTAQSFYLINLLLAPGLAFLVLVLLWSRHREAPQLARCHLRHTLIASLWAGGLLGLFSGLVLVILGWEFAHTWLFVLLYFITFHSGFVLLGMLGLAKAMAGKHYHFPVVGAACVEAVGASR